MKHFTKQAWILSLFTSLLVGCSHDSDTNTTSNASSTNSSSPATTNNSTEATTYKIITTTFPEYDWTKNILGEQLEQVELIQLLDNGIDLHSYTPSIDDIVKIASCDLFIHTGGPSYTWVDDVLAQAINPDLIVVNLMEALGSSVKITEYVEGMEAHDHDEHDHDEHDHDEHDHDDHDHDEHDHDEHDHDDHDHDELDHDEHNHDDHDHDDHDHDDHDHDEHDHDEHDHDEHDHDEHDHDEHDHDEHDHDDHDHDEHDHDEHDHDEEPDEHFWMSILNASTLCTSLADALSTLDPENADLYHSHLKNYQAELMNLHQSYSETLNDFTVDTIVVADRFPFRYLVDDYNINYYAAFSGCSAESEASFETVVFLAEKVNELSLDYVLTTETSHELAQTVVDSTNTKDQTILALNSMQSTTSKENTSYIQIMEENLSVLEEILK